MCHGIKFITKGAPARVVGSRPLLRLSYSQQEDLAAAILTPPVLPHLPH